MYMQSNDNDIKVQVRRSSVEVVRLDVGGDLRLPLVAVVEQLLLVVEQLFVGLGAELKVGALHNGVHGTCLLAKSAVDALGHVDVVSGSSSGPVSALLCLNGDGLSRADGFAEFAGDASLLSAGVTPQSVFPTKPG